MRENWKKGTRFWIILDSSDSSDSSDSDRVIVKIGPCIFDRIENGRIIFHFQEHPLVKGEISITAKTRRLPGPYPHSLCSN